MDMHTDTTAHLAAEAGTVPGRAGSVMDQALSEAPSSPPTLMDLYDERNDLMDPAGGGAQGLDLARVAELEHQIIAAPCLSIVDASAKLGLVNMRLIEGNPLSEDVAQELVNAAHGIVWAMAGSWQRGRQPSTPERNFDRAAVARRAAMAQMRAGTLTRDQHREIANEYERWRFVFFACTPDHPASLAKLIAELAAEHGYDDIHAIATDPLGLSPYDVKNLSLVGFVHAYRGALQMMPGLPTSEAIAELLPRFERLYATEREAMDAEAENDDFARTFELSRISGQAIDATTEVVREIMAVPAASLADFRAKARMIEWGIGGGHAWDDRSEPVIFRPLVRALVEELVGRGPTTIDYGQPTPLAAE